MATIYHRRSLARVLLHMLFVVSFRQAAGQATPLGKRGLPFDDPNLLNNFAVPGSLVTWCYNWYSATWKKPPSLDYVPMFSCSTDVAIIDAWTKNAATIINSSPPNSVHILGFEEPDNPKQCNISPIFAAYTYIPWMQRFQGQAYIGAPAVSVGNLGWLTDFLNACKTCRIDFVPIHWYGPAGDVKAFQAYVLEAYNAGQNRPIWVTEFYAEGNVEQQLQFMRDAITWLDMTPFVERYAWNGAFIGDLVNVDGSLTALGAVYAFTPDVSRQ